MEIIIIAFLGGMCVFLILLVVALNKQLQEDRIKTINLLLSLKELLQNVDESSGDDNNPTIKIE